MRAPTLILVAALVSSCTLPPVPTSTPARQPGPSVVAPLQSAPATSLESASPSPTPDLSAIPDFNGGEIVTTTFAGLRVRQLPGTDQRVVTGLLGFDAELEVVMGPIVEDDLGWYLVLDADDEEPEFDEGWVAAGIEPEANLRSTGRVADDSLVVASFAQVGDAEFGPIEIPDERHVIRWVVVDPEQVRCQFSIMLAAGSGAPIPAIRATLGDELVPGTLPSSFFVAQPGLRGQVFLSADTDCAWALAVLREPPPEPTPT